MIQVKILELKDKEVSGFRSYPLFKEALNRVVGHEVETVYEQDPFFEGYYLVPIGSNNPSIYNKEIINKKSLLLSVINSNIPFFTEYLKPAGVTNWVLFKEASTAIIGNQKALERYGYRDSDFGVTHGEYKSVVPIQSDGSFEKTAQSILKYLEIYDNYLKAIGK
jgi:hypothetical protein